MRYEFKLPDIGEGIAEAEIVAWHVKVGDTIAEDQQIADMMTDKATVEMESPVAGKVLQLAGEVGDQVPIRSTTAMRSGRSPTALLSRLPSRPKRFRSSPSRNPGRRQPPPRRRALNPKSR
jgi:2-oxoisovalerate dehydrogenase E2 component (dihydrolipoyl transacylase)